MKKEFLIFIVLALTFAFLTGCQQQGRATQGVYSPEYAQYPASQQDAINYNSQSGQLYAQQPANTQQERINYPTQKQYTQQKEYMQKIMKDYLKQEAFSYKSDKISDKTEVYSSQIRVIKRTIINEMSDGSKIIDELNEEGDIVKKVIESPEFYIDNEIYKFKTTFTFDKNGKLIEIEVIHYLNGKVINIEVFGPASKEVKEFNTQSEEKQEETLPEQTTGEII
jgi:hypothetical protein